jgi:hypothetical protein
VSTAPVMTAHEPEMAQHVTSRRAESTAFRYFVVALTACVLIYLLPFALMRSGVNPGWVLSYWGRVIETNYHLDHQDADVVIFGDSTAATNFDPVRLGRDLHLKVIVLPNVSTSLPVSGFQPLVHYLAENKQPRLIVFYFSGWDLDFIHNPFTQIVEEGQEMLLLHGSWPEVLHYARTNPRKMLMFPLHFYATSNRFGDLVYFRAHEIPRLELGHITDLPHPTPMKPDCEFNLSRLTNAAADTSTREGVQQFTKPGTQTLVYISPIPRCKYLQDVENLRHPGLDVAPVQVLAPKNFREDGWQAHMLTKAIGPSTESLEAAIRGKLAAAPEPTR